MKKSINFTLKIRPVGLCGMMGSFQFGDILNTQPHHLNHFALLAFYNSNDDFWEVSSIKLKNFLSEMYRTGNMSQAKLRLHMLPNKMTLSAYLKVLSSKVNSQCGVLNKLFFQTNSPVSQ